MEAEQLSAATEALVACAGGAARHTCLPPSAVLPEQVVAAHQQRAAAEVAQQVRAVGLAVTRVAELEA